MSRLRSSTLLIGLLTSCAGAPPSPAAWVEVETEHIRLRTVATAEAARETATRFESMHDAIVAAGFGCKKPKQAELFEVTLLAQEDFASLGVPDASGFYAEALVSLVSKPGQIVLRREQGIATRQVFQHELTHRLVARCFPSAPAWLHEGLASFFETTNVQGERVSIGLPPYIFTDDVVEVRYGVLRGSLVAFVRPELVPAPTRLLAMDRDAFYLPEQATTEQVHAQRTANYAAAWALVHTMQLGDQGAHSRLFDYLETLSRGDLPEAESWTRHFHDLHLDTVVARHLKAEPSYLEFELEPIDRAAPTARTLDDAEVELQWAWLSAVVGPLPARALAHAGRAKEHASTRAEAHLVAALVMLWKRDRAGAETELRAGLAAEPSNPALLSLFIELLVGDAERTDAELDTLAARLRNVAGSAESFVALTHYDLVAGNVGAAMGDSQRAVTLRPQGHRTWAARARALGAAAQWEAALRAVERANNLLPHDTPGLPELDDLERSLREAMPNVESQLEKDAAAREPPRNTQ